MQERIISKLDEFSAGQLGAQEVADLGNLIISLIDTRRETFMDALWWMYCEILVENTENFLRKFA